MGGEWGGGGVVLGKPVMNVRQLEKFPFSAPPSPCLDLTPSLFLFLSHLPALLPRGDKSDSREGKGGTIRVADCFAESFMRRYCFFCTKRQVHT